MALNGGNTVVESAAIALINQERQRNGLRPLQVDATLNRLTAIKAQDMAVNQSCEHYSPTIGGDEGVLLNREGITNVYAVFNIACGPGSTLDTAQKVVNAWINSPPHYANILDPNITRIGIGQVYSPQNNTNYWSMIATSDFQARNGWVQQGGKWYFYVNGIPQTGWVQVGELWYLLDNTGAWTQWLYKAPFYHYYNGTNWSTYYYDAQNKQWWFWNGTAWIRSQ